MKEIKRGGIIILASICVFSNTTMAILLHTQPAVQGVHYINSNATTEIEGHLCHLPLRDVQDCSKGKYGRFFIFIAVFVLCTCTHICTWISMDVYGYMLMWRTKADAGNYSKLLFLLIYLFTYGLAIKLRACWYV